MAETIRLELKCSPLAAVSRAQDIITSRRGRFCGTPVSGTFSVPVGTTFSGSYRIIGNVLELRIARKSVLLSRADIVRYLRDQLAMLELEMTRVLPLNCTAAA